MWRIILDQVTAPSWALTTVILIFTLIRTIMPDILFFRSTTTVERNPPDATLGSLVAWQPGLASIKPQGLRWFPYAVWWLFHYSGVFRNEQYRIFLLREQDGVVHRSCVFPPYFRFPFMSRQDLQVGDIWTLESRRGQGLSAAVLKHIIDAYPQRCLWFLCDASNTASANLARSAGMQFVGVGSRRPRFGLSALSQFVLNPGDPAK